MLRFSQWPMMPASSAAAHATPPSWKAKRRFGKRIGTPPKTSDRQVPSIGGGEVADLVVGVVDGRHAGSPALAAGVEGRCHAELLAAPPDRVVVVERVVTEGVDPPARAAGAVVIGARDRAPQHDGLEPELTDGVVELGDRLLGRVGRYRGDRLESVAKAGVDLGVVAVQRVRQRAPQLGVRHRRHGSPYVGYTTAKSMPSSSRRWYISSGSMTVARSRVLRVGRPQTPDGEHAELAPLRRRRHGRSRPRPSA